MQLRKLRGGQKGALAPPAPLEAVLSINGGDPSLRQGDSVEMMTNPRSSGYVEFYDISFQSGHPDLSNRNPQLCMNCHGRDGTSMNGIRTIFEPLFDWTRFVGGISDDNGCPIERAYLRKHEALSRTAIGANPAYRCLDQSGSNDPRSDAFVARQRENLTDLGARLSKLNDRDVARLVAQSRDYSLYKFAIIGSLVCENGGGQRFNPSEWMPQNLIKMNNNMESIDPRIVNSSNLSKTFRSIAREQKEASRVVLNANASETGKIGPGHLGNFQISVNSQACLKDGSGGGSGVGVGSGSGHQNDSPTHSSPSTYDRYVIDTQPKMFRNNQGNSAFRYLMESRGIPTLPFQMSPAQDSYMDSHDGLAGLLLAREPAHSEVRQALEAALQTRPGSDVMNRACDLLKKQSVGATSGSGAATPAGGKQIPSVR